MKDFPLQDFYGDIYSSYDRVNRIFTFGRDRVWRRKAVHELLKQNPERVLDLCTGTGDFVLEAGRILNVEQALAAHPERLTFSGIGVYHRALFAQTPAGEKAPLAPLLRRAIDVGRASGEHHRGRWTDVGTPERLQQLDESLGNHV